MDISKNLGVGLLSTYRENTSMDMDIRRRKKIQVAR
jgi:hypothetical protein